MEKGRQKDTLSETVHKELRVVLSRNRSPLSLRVARSGSCSWASRSRVLRRTSSTGIRRGDGRGRGENGEMWRRRTLRRVGPKSPSLLSSPSRVG
jgi:hypothetical protein